MTEEKKRKFAIPYNNKEPFQFVRKAEGYKENLDHVYFGITGIDLSHNNPTGDITKLYNNSMNFLEYSRGKFPRVLTLNQTAILMDDGEKYGRVLTGIAPYIEKYGIEGVIVTDLNLARSLHNIFPRLEIHTSCNTYSFIRKNYDYWKQIFGDSLASVNPPREFFRNEKLREELKDIGIPIKAIVNEACYYGCPQNVNHACYIGNVQSNNIVYFCDRREWKYSDILRTNFILPRHLKLFDDCVDVYKIAGRYRSTEEIFQILDYYVNERNDVDLFHLLSSRFIHGRIIDKGLKLPVKNVPDKILTCECKDCGKNCSICEKVMEKAVIKSGLSKQDLYPHEI